MKTDSLQRIATTANAIRKEMSDIEKSFCFMSDRYVSYEAFAKIYNDLAGQYENKVDGFKLARIDTAPRPMKPDWHWMKAIFQETYTKTGILEVLARPQLPTNGGIGFNHLIHPRIQEVSMRHYLDGDFRNAVLDSITVIYDAIRERTGLSEDGERLINQVFAGERPKLIVSGLETESGQNDQKGFTEICRGFYRSVRNPKAHTLAHNLDEIKAAQYLVLSSILMRRVMDSTPP